MADVDAFSSATSLVAALRSGAIGARELTELYIRRIERHDPALNAVVVRDYTRAREQAMGAEHARARREHRALLGLPITLKESINVTGLHTSCGVPEWKGYISQHDAPVTTRTRAAGAVLLGKTNVPPMLADWQSANPIFGCTNNPWDRGRTPGGSSGGSAAAIAAGLSALEVGSDIGGSIRVPAAFCGIYGHRPSETLLPRSGQFPMPPLPNSAVVMGVQGPLARSAEDLELALSVLAGPEVGEDVAWKVTLPAARRERLADFRVAVLPPIPWLPVDEQITAALQDLAGRLAKMGAMVKEIQPEGLGDHREYHGFYRTKSGTLVQFDAPNAGTQSGNGTDGFDINVSGAIVGIYWDDSGEGHAFLRAADGTYTEYDAAGAGFYGTYGTSINKDGWIAGSYYDSNRALHGYVRDPSGNITEFDAPDAGTGSGQGTWAVDNHTGGKIVGWYVDSANVGHGFVRAKNRHDNGIRCTERRYRIGAGNLCVRHQQAQGDLGLGAG
jgi:Asp-tRNA(Asn)/Glu-tRNA(Gln) amidotransferase A subunit family amidase